MDTTLTIAGQLKAIEQKHNVDILYACESGSRAWGFESPDSDYDVRFIYVPKDIGQYLRIGEQPRDVIELPIVGDLDINGWDIRKALNLIYASNPTVFEWLNSPIIYCQTELVIFQQLIDLLPRFYSVVKAHYHYMHMASKNYKEHIAGKAEVKYKKYLYIIRPLLAAQYVNAGKGIPPVAFAALFEETKNELSNCVKIAIDELLAIKMQGNEIDIQPCIPILNSFIEDSLKKNDGHFSQKFVKTLDDIDKDAQELSEFMKTFALLSVSSLDII